MSEILNSYFGSAFTKENLSDNLLEVQHVFKGDLSSNLTDIVITPEVVIEKLEKKLKSNKALCTDGLVSGFFLRTSETICLPLNITFRKSLDEGVVPKSWQTFLLFKKNDPRMMRVITNLSV